MKRSDLLFQRIVATWRALGRRAEVEARRFQDEGQVPETDAEPAIDDDVTDEADLGPENDDLVVWTEGGLLLFTLLRILLRSIDPDTLETLGKEISDALAELTGRAGINGYGTVAADDGAITSDLAMDDELMFLAAFNEDLMMRHQERVRIVDQDRIELAKLGVAETLSANLQAFPPEP
jgi:hypothetical protein